LVRYCVRATFAVIEFWIENSLMIEFLTGDMTADYLAFIQPEAYANLLASMAIAH
jgi:hypothetical protein